MPTVTHWLHYPGMPTVIHYSTDLSSSPSATALSIPPSLGPLSSTPTISPHTLAALVARSLLVQRGQLLPVPVCGLRAVWRHPANSATDPLRST